jgi:hypothetical protein
MAVDKPHDFRGITSWAAMQHTEPSLRIDPSFSSHSKRKQPDRRSEVRILKRAATSICDAVWEAPNALRKLSCTDVLEACGPARGREFMQNSFGTERGPVGLFQDFSARACQHSCTVSTAFYCNIILSGQRRGVDRYTLYFSRCLHSRLS